MGDKPTSDVKPANPKPANPLTKWFDDTFGPDDSSKSKSKGKTGGSGAQKRSKGTGGTPPPNNVSGPPFVDSDFKNPVYAAHNTQVGPKTHLPVRTSETNLIGVIRNNNNKSYTNDESENVDRFLARVLRVENAGTEMEGESLLFGWLDNLKSMFSGGEGEQAESTTEHVEITALTDCDIHACAWGVTGVGHPEFSLPNQNGEGGSQFIIDYIRDSHHAHFTAAGPAKIPVPGEFVWVTWKDLPNRKDGVYLGPLDPTNPEACAANNNSNKNPCDKLNSNSPDGNSPYNSNAGGLSNNWGAKLRKRINAKIERGQHPVGKGVFTGYPNIGTHKVQMAEEATLNWVCYTGIKQTKESGIPEKFFDRTRSRTLTDKYHKKGIRTYVMGYPFRGYEEKFVADMMDIANTTGVVGIIVNLDNYYADESKISAPHDREKYLMTTLKEQAKKAGFCIGLTATNIINRKNVPWKVFSGNDGMDFCIPQVLAQSYSAKRDTALTKTEEEELAAGQQGPTNGIATTFKDITPDNFKTVANSISITPHPKADYTNLESFKQKWFERGIDRSSSNDFNTRSLFTMGACEVIEQYWRQQGVDAKLKITSHKRAGDKGNHTTGGAIDIRIEIDGKRQPVLQTWGGLKKLIAAGRIPNGGAGLYLNVGSGGITGVNPSQAGKNAPGTGALAGPGGSASPHYDMRSYTYSEGKTGNTTWLWLDTDGDGSDEIKTMASSISWLNSNNRSDIANYVRKGNGTWRTDQYTPGVTGEVWNMKQILGLKSTPPMLPTTSGELLFMKQFEAWMAVGFKNIIPGLGMLGSSPKPSGWMTDYGAKSGYNTEEKSPWRMRQDATWTFTSTRQSIHKVMADAIIWWDWDNADFHHKDWPEERWDIIRELGNATAAAEKLKSLKKSSMPKEDKEKIKKYQLGEYLKHSPSPGEELEAKKATAEEAPVKTPKEKIPSTTETTEPPETTQLTEAQKKEIQDNIDNKSKTLKEKEEEMQALKEKLKSLETAGTSEEKDKTLEDIKIKEKEIKDETNEINTLKAKLSKNKASESTNQESTVQNSEGQETQAQASEEHCAKDSGGGGGGGGRQGATTGLAKGEIKESKLPGVDFVDFGFPTYARKTTNFIIIHNPGGTSGNHRLLAKILLKKKLGVHFSVEPTGKQRQHVDLELACSHASPENYNSIGIEAMVKSKKITPNPLFVPGSRGFYESVYSLCKKICKATSIPLTVPHANLTEGKFYFGQNRGAWGGLKPGIIAHGSWYDQRSDGRMETLYIALRLNGNSPGSAYKMARKAHDDQKVKTRKEGKYGWARIQGLKKGEANMQVDWTAPLSKEDQKAVDKVLAAQKKAKALQDKAIKEAQEAQKNK